MRTICPTHRILHGLITVIICGETPHFAFSCSSSSWASCVRPCSSLRVRDQVSWPYKTLHSCHRTFRNMLLCLSSTPPHPQLLVTTQSVSHQSGIVFTCLWPRRVAVPDLTPISKKYQNLALFNLIGCGNIWQVLSGNITKLLLTVWVQQLQRCWPTLVWIHSRARTLHMVQS
jgi:hypothetical protein